MNMSTAATMSTLTLPNSVASQNGKISSSGSDQTLESTLAPSSSSSESVSVMLKSGKQKPLNVDMAAMLKSAGEGHAPINSRQDGLPYFPSAASLNSSAWSSSGYSDETDASDSFAWSSSLHSSDSGSNSDLDSASDSDLDSDSDSDLDSDSDSDYSESDLSDEDGEGAQGFLALPPRPLPPRPLPPRPLPPRPLPTCPLPPAENGPPIVQEGLGALTSDGIPLAFASLKRDLEKIGRCIISSNVGNVHIQRAQTLASINWLSNHVPNAVLDQLGHEIRAMLEEEKEGSKPESCNDEIASVVNSDSMSEVSDLSDAYINELGDEHENPADDADINERYGDLANFACAKANSFLPVGCEAEEVKAEDLRKPGSEGVRGMTQSSLLDAGALIPEEQPTSAQCATEHPEAPNSMAQSSLLEAGALIPEDQPAMAESSTEFLDSKHRPTTPQHPSNLREPSNTKEFPSRPDDLGKGSVHSVFSAFSGHDRRRTSISSKSSVPFSLMGGQNRRSSLGSQTSIGRHEKISTMTSPQVSVQSSKSSKSKKQGVRGLLKRFIKRSRNDAKSLKKDELFTECSTSDGNLCLQHEDAKVSHLQEENPSPVDQLLLAKDHPSLGIELHPEYLEDIDAKQSSTRDDSDFSQSLRGSSSGSSNGTIVTGDINSENESREVCKGADLPRASMYRCALLFVDISGFTKLSTQLDPESLSKAINSYFELIVDEVTTGKGDLLKFAGDAIFIEWKATSNINLENCVEAAVTCAANLVSKCSDFKVLVNATQGSPTGLDANQSTKIDSLNVHCGIGAGQMVGVHVGDHELRREYLLLGQPIQQATIATDFANLGEVAVSHEALGLLARVCELHEDIAHVDGKKSPVVIAERAARRFRSKQRLGVHQPKIVNELSRGVTSHVEGLEVDALRKYRRRMSLYVHPVVVDNDVAASGDFKSGKTKKTAQERHREEAELRNVYVMFVNPMVEVRVTKNEKSNKRLFKELNDIMNLSSREIKRFCGHLRQFIVDDKGLVMIITFGLRGTTIPNMVAQRALPATIAIHNALQLELGVQSKIGATIGEAYCGVVGGVKRHEYAVLGPSVNLAARLMASETNPGILVDHKVRMMASRSYAFNALAPVVAKGYNEPVPIFEPLSPLERMWGRIQPNFVGRKQEIMTLMGMARDMVLSDSPSKMVLVEAQSGMGKTTMIAHCIEHIRKLMGANKHRLIVTKNVSKESDSLVPFGIFRSILLDVLSNFRMSNDDKSYKSGVSCYSSLQNSITWESLSGRSTAQSTSNLTTNKSADVLRNVCRELDMPTSFIEHALHSLLGIDYPGNDKTTPKVKPPTTKLMVSFMARAFKRCTQDSKLVIVALDDVHRADELSWRVIREIFENSQNVLVIGATAPLDTCNLKVEPNFWDKLIKLHREDGRFVSMELGCLAKEETISMIMKTLGLQRTEVNEDLSEGVMIQSGGMPHFINEILEHIKRRMANDAEGVGSDFGIHDMTCESFGDLVLQRLDAFDASSRNMLNIGAVIGLSFTLDEMVAVQMRTSDEQERILRVSAADSLKALIHEGILEAEEVDSEGEGGSKTKRYSFYHAVWQRAVLNLMLEGRKRDLHRMIAESLEEQKMGVEDHMLQTKIFNHWKNSENFGKAAELAVNLGKHFEGELGLPAQSIKLYNEALDLVRKNSDISGGIAGFTSERLLAVGDHELEFIVRLQVALGHAFSMAQKMTESVTAYQDALKLVQATKSSAQIHDRSILFPVFTGLSLALKRGYIVQDAECRYEQAMIHRYVLETKQFKDPIYIIHAITLQAEMYSRLGDFVKAIESHEQLLPVYDMEEHSVRLCDEYGSDLGAQSFASSTLWNLHLENSEDALGTCWYVIEELMPKLERKNVHACFMIIYPVLWVMKENGYALEAREYFEEFVCEAYTEYFGEGRSTFFLPLYDPVLMLLDLTGNADIDDDTISEYLNWALDIDNLSFGTLINSKTGELGRTADSIAAEICYLLAKRIGDEDDRACLIENGIEVAAEDLDFAKEKRLVLAEYCVSNMLSQLEDFEESDDE